VPTVLYYQEGIRILTTDWAELLALRRGRTLLKVEYHTQTLKGVWVDVGRRW